MIAISSVGIATDVRRLTVQARTSPLPPPPPPPSPSLLKRFYFPFHRNSNQALLSSFSTVRAFVLIGRKVQNSPPRLLPLSCAYTAIPVGFCGQSLHKKEAHGGRRLLISRNLCDNLIASTLLYHIYCTSRQSPFLLLPPFNASRLWSAVFAHAITCHYG